MESREGDRFSPRMRMLSTDRDNYDECVETSPHLLTGTRIVLRRDIDMATQEAVQAGRTPRVQHRNVREIAALRARRAARRWYHIDAESMVVRTLAALADKGQVDPSVVQQAIDKYELFNYAIQGNDHAGEE